MKTIYRIPVFAKLTSILLFALSYVHGNSQVVASFENFDLERGQYINDASPSLGFQSGNVELPNEYNKDFSFWSGFAISADTNTTTPGFTNQYSAITGTGADGTQTYAVGYILIPFM